MKACSEQFLGIGIGASRIKLVVLNGGNRVVSVSMHDHYGDPRGKLKEMLKEFPPQHLDGVAVTGRETDAILAIPKIFESECIEESMRLLGFSADVVISLGGESFVVYPVHNDGTITDCISGNRCAAGTVEFFKQQLGRMGLTISQATEIAGNGKIVPLARRCSVHCKSDCTHALNKKRCSVEDIVRTLCRNIAEKACGLVTSAGLKNGRALVIGGASVNKVIIEDIRSLLSEFEIIVPEHAEYFEAFGAALLARRHPIKINDWNTIFVPPRTSFGFREPLYKFLDKTIFLPSSRGCVRNGGQYIMGVDGGSTTTKVALVDMETLQICASHYTRTNGNPERAFKECLIELQRQIHQTLPDGNIQIIGIATTGSSGEILSVLCGTHLYHNEIVAHAYASAHYCPDVDTIFEIGGQDSKFTSLRCGVPVDFNMNESCSAGTGSFIEETARDDLGVPVEKIAEMALRSEKPPRFSDQCAAFANSDIRKSAQEGASREDNLAGLVYAIVDNYINKVVGKRKIGNKILFQGGTSKNKAIACAFAAKTGKNITVPPDPELTGCFGIALWLREKLIKGVVKPNKYSIHELLKTTVTENNEFVCNGCDNYCTIKKLGINGKIYPFGGQCSMWENVRRHIKIDVNARDFVALREKLLLEVHGVPPIKTRKIEKKLNDSSHVIGLPMVFSTLTFYPLYSWFFHQLGYSIVLSDRIDSAGIQRCQTSRCYPYEIAHGTFQNLLSAGVKTIFIPHITYMPPDDGDEPGITCPISQATPYYLRSAFNVPVFSCSEKIDDPDNHIQDKNFRILAPVLNMQNGLRSVENTFVAIAQLLGHNEKKARIAFQNAVEKQQAFWRACRDEGKKILQQIEAQNGTGIVLVGRPYNAFVRIANLGVPRKFASADVTIIPADFLLLHEVPCEDTMYWEYGRMILRALRYVRENPSLFAVYISNFGCGPDSFIQHFANRIMGEKPYLYLELDSHTADAGITTRVSAFLDVIAGYREVIKKTPKTHTTFSPAEIVCKNKKVYVRDSKGNLVFLKDPRVTLIIPSMGRYNTEALSAACRCYGVNALPLPPADENILATGREFTSGKECLPCVLTVGALMDYYRTRFRRTRDDEILVFFMPTAQGPCRFGQYNVFMQALIEDLRMEDVTLLSLTAENGYLGMGTKFLIMGYIAAVIADAMNDIRALLESSAIDKSDALTKFDSIWRNILRGIEGGAIHAFRALYRASKELSVIALKPDYKNVSKVLLTGEIFVRHDELSRRNIEKIYNSHGFMVKTSGICEWIYYTDWNKMYKLATGNGNGYNTDFLTLRYLLRKALESIKGNKASYDFVRTRLKLEFERMVERIIRHILRKSGKLITREHHIHDIVQCGSQDLHPSLAGEAILSSGCVRHLFYKNSSEKYCGTILIGPFNCMPTGIAESLIKPHARRKNIPYLTFETDGSPIPLNLRNQIEVHLLRSKRYAEQSYEKQTRGNSHTG